MRISLIAAVLIGLASISQQQSQTTVQPFDFCRTYEDDCAILMGAVNCPSSNIESHSCTDNTLSTFNGTCACGGFDVGSGRLVETVIDSRIKSQVPRLLVYTASGSVDTCASYTAICKAFYTAINCPVSLQMLSTCANCLPTANFNSDASCVCGSMDTASNRIQELIVDVIIATEASATTHSPVNSSMSTDKLSSVPWFWSFCLYLVLSSRYDPDV